MQIFSVSDLQQNFESQLLEKRKLKIYLSGGVTTPMAGKSLPLQKFTLTNATGETPMRFDLK